MSAPLNLHSRCEVEKLGTGEILFVGQTSFSPGVWVGVELDEKNGKNDGTVQGKRYFDCEDGYGVFARPGKVVMIEDDRQEQQEQHEQEPEEQQSSDEGMLMEEELDIRSQSPRKAAGPSVSNGEEESLFSVCVQVFGKVKKGMWQVESHLWHLPLSRLLQARIAANVAAASRPPAKVGSTSSRASLAPATTARKSVAPTTPGRPTSRQVTRSPNKLAPGTPLSRTLSSASSRSAASVSATSSRAVTPARPGVNATPKASAAPGVTPRSRLSVAGASSTSTANKTGRASMAPPGATRTGTTSTTSAASGSAAAGRAGLRPVLNSRVSMRPAGTTPPSTTPSQSSPSSSRVARTEMTRSQSAQVWTAPPSSLNPSGRSSVASGRRSVAGSNAPVSASAALARKTGNATSTSTPQSRPSGASSSSGSNAGAISSRRSSASNKDRATEEEDAEELMSMSLPDSDFNQRDAELDDGSEEEELIKSPTTRMSALSPNALRDHMSLLPPSASNTSVNSPRNAAAMGALQREVEELRVKNRLLEKKRDEDREKIREGDKIREEAEEFLKMKNKMGTKQADLQSELRDLHKLEKDWSLEKEHLERQVEDLNEQLEMATMDKEIAEEKAEAFQAEKEQLSQDKEELDIEVQVLREENALYEHGDVNESEKSSAGYMQLEKQNARLKDALIRLRDITNETDMEQRRKISELDKELASLGDIESSYESVTARLADAEVQVEDLKEQLDNALGAEELLEDLTERNLNLGEKIDEMAAIIEDLEALKDLNDELEETHVETEKQLQEEVDLKDLQLRDYRARNDGLESNLADYEQTFSQFRELVLNLQSDLETMRAEREEEENGIVLGVDAGGIEGVTTAGPIKQSKLATQAQAMLNLNLRLQSSALKSQSKTIELELGKLSASQSQAHLEMIQPYLPGAYSEAGDADAVDALLFFRRMAHKADLLKAVVEGHHDLAGALSLAGKIPENLIEICRMRRSLAHFAAVSRQIAAVLQLAPVEVFLRGGRMYRELAGVEKRIDSFIEALRKEELREVECGKEFHRFANQFEEFSYALGVEDGDADLAAKEVGAAMLIDHDLDTLVAALGFSKQSIATLWEDPEVEWDQNGGSIEEDIFEPLQKLVDQVRGTKVPARKVLRRLGQLYSSDEAVKMELIMTLPGIGQLSGQLVTFAASLAKSTALYSAEVRTSKIPFAISQFSKLVEESMKEGLSQADPKDEMWKTSLASTTHISTTINTLLAVVTEQENVFKVVGSKPWLLRVEQIRAEAAHNVDSERQVVKLTEDARDLYRQIKVRDGTLQESNIKIERLSKQLERSKEESTEISSVRNNLLEAQKQAKAYQEAHEALQSELESNEKNLDKLKIQLAGLQQSSADSSKKAEGNAGNENETFSSFGNGSGLGSGSSIETGYLLDQVQALKGAVKFLRTENSHLKSYDAVREMDSLPLLTYKSRQDEVKVEEEEEEEENAIKLEGLPIQPRRHLNKAQTLRAFTDESKVLYSQLLRLTSSPKVVDLSLQSRNRTKKNSEQKTENLSISSRKPWTPLSTLPESQYKAQKALELETIRRVGILAEKVRNISFEKTGSGGGSMGFGRFRMPVIASLGA